MTILSDGLTALTLPDDLLRIDEHDWSPVHQAVTPTLTGALWIDVSSMQAGEPITLAGGQDYGLITRAEFAQLRALADVAGKVCSLTLRGSTYSVMWRHEDSPALSARDWIDYADPDPADWVIPTLKFTRIA